MMTAKPSPKPRSRARGVKQNDLRSPARSIFLPSGWTPAPQQDQSAGVTVKSEKYMRLSALDQSPMRPDTGCDSWCSR